MRVFDPWCWQSCYSAQNLSTFPLLVFLQILLSMEYFSTYTFKVQFIKTISRVMICWRTFASIILLDWGLFNGYVLSWRVFTRHVQEGTMPGCDWRLHLCRGSARLGRLRSGGPGVARIARTRSLASYCSDNTSCLLFLPSPLATRVSRQKNRYHIPCR